MLRQLLIKNFTLIDQLEVDFYPGFSVITGETGAGKSIILGALGLLLGNRADSKVIKDGAQRCTVEAHFDIANYDMKHIFDENDIDYFEDDCIIRREVNANGKSRAFINDTPASLSVLKELGEQLIDIHSQHQNLLLQKDDFQMSVVDIIAQSKPVVEKYKKAFEEYHSAKTKLQKTKENIAANAANADYVRFVYEELAELKLQEGEDEQLEQLQNTMQHSEDIKSGLYEIDSNMSDEDTGAITRLYRCLSALRTITKVYPQAEDIHERLDSAYIEIKDISAEIAGMLEDVDYDPDELQRINERLDRIYSLEHKHHVNTVNELIELEKQFKETLNGIDNSEEALDELEKAVAKALKDAEKEAKELTKLRKAGAKLIEKEMAERLKPLGLPNVRFNVEVSPVALAQNGADKVEFLFSANPGTPLRPVSQIASGGEIARVMLSLKAMLSGAVKLPTIIFDEIDTGVSGRVAEQMAVIMKEMGLNERQVISITHLPQIAAMGSNHYKVYKEQDATETRSHMNHLNDEERINEIAQMLSGSNITEAAIHNAKELLGKQ
ncbi:MAG: DNA repair protein RecN [Prevotellaceae bacterium]|nr:DNA repair protein RecN [Prevotellaceae bacterium]